MSIQSPANAMAFWEYIRKEKMAKNDYDFSRHVFPEFLSRISDFFWNTHPDESDFRRFSRDVSFAEATFLGDAKFDLVRFCGRADFSGAKFNSDANFRRTLFSGRADFSGACFVGNANFSGADFREDANFSYSRFSGWADFMGTRFTYSGFGFCRFSGLTSFEGASCSRGAALIGATGSIKGLINGRIPSEQEQHDLEQRRRTLLSDRPRKKRRWW